jgi:hypothetical protein
MLNISSTGVVYEQDASSSCVITGQFSLIDPAYNAYDVAPTYSGADCDINLSGATGKGLASLDNTVSPTVLEMMVTLKNPSGDVFAIALYQETAN